MIAWVVLFCRHEFGSFYPANNDGFYAMTGEGPGAGYNINVPWENGRCGDADYLAVWDHILIPVAKDFNPDIVIISAGFDAGFVVVTLSLGDLSIIFPFPFSPPTSQALLVSLLDVSFEI